MSKKYIFMGSDSFALGVLEKLEKEFKPEAIVTQPDRPRGRKMKIQQGPLSRFATEGGYKLLQPESLKNEEDQNRLLEIPSDLHIVVSFGQILPKSLIDRSPPLINAHASLLPKYRGASPIESAILAGEKEAGVCIMHIEPKLDAGPVISRRSTAISELDDNHTLRERLISMSAELLSELIRSEDPIPSGVLQDHASSTHCSKIKKEDCLLDPSVLSAKQADRLIRAFSPRPGAYLFLKQGDHKVRLKINRAKISEISGTPGIFKVEEGKIFLMLKEQSLELQMIQPEGKKPMECSAFLNGWKHPLEVASVDD